MSTTETETSVPGLEGHERAFTLESGAGESACVVVEAVRVQSVDAVVEFRVLEVDPATGLALGGSDGLIGCVSHRVTLACLDVDVGPDYIPGLLAPQWQRAAEWYAQSKWPPLASFPLAPPFPTG